MAHPCFDDGKNLIKPRVRVFGSGIDVLFIVYTCGVLLWAFNVPPVPPCHIICSTKEKCTRNKYPLASQCGCPLHSNCLYRALDIHIYMYIICVLATERPATAHTNIQLPQKKGFFTLLCAKSQQKKTYKIIKISAPT